MVKTDTSYGLVKTSVKFDSDIPIAWKHYIENKISETVKILSKEYDTYRIYKSEEQDKHVLDWMC